MKKLFFLPLILCATMAMAQQKDALLLDDFEGGVVSFTSTINPLSGMQIQVADNPSKSGINTSNKALEMIRKTTSDNWAGFWARLNTTRSGYKYLHVKYYRSNDKSLLRINVEGGAGKKEFLPKVAPSKTSEWESLVFDLSANGVTTMEVLGFQPDFVSPSTSGTVTYVDDIILSDTETLSSAFVDQRPSIRAEALQPTLFTLKWNPIDSATQYEIYKDGVAFTTSSATSVNVTGLSSFDIYYFTVKAQNAKGAYTKMSEPLYVATPETTEQRNNRMAWWRESRFGMFIHWGGYATYAGRFVGKNVKGKDVNFVADGGQNGSYAEWIMFGGQIPRDTYQAKIASDMTAASYDPKEWVRMAKSAGMKYIIFTSKHHEGLSMFNTNVGWNVVQHSAAQKDLMRGLADEARAAGLKIGFYYSQALDWNNPGGMDWMPQNNNGNGGVVPLDSSVKYVENLVIPHLQTLINDYDADVIWWDMGGASTPELKYRTIKSIKNIPGTERLIFNDRLEDHLTGDFKTPEQSIPNMPVGGDGTDWETCMTMNRNWGYASPDIDTMWKTVPDLLHKLIDITSKGGNFLLNIGPKADGTFPQESIDRLAAIGTWMDVNSEAIYGTQPSPFITQLPWGRATRKIEGGKTYLYLHVFDWPANGNLVVPGLVSDVESAYLLSDANKTPLTVSTHAVGKQVAVPTTAPHAISSTVVFVINSEVVDTEVPPILQAEDGTLKLCPGQAQVSGNISVENTPANLGGWTNTDDYPFWKVGITQAIELPFNMEVAGYDGSVKLSIDGDETAAMAFKVKKGGDFNQYKTVRLSEGVSLKEGTYDIALKRISSGGWDPINVRCITFGNVPIDTIPTNIFSLKKADTKSIVINVNPVSEELYFTVKIDAGLSTIVVVNTVGEVLLVEKRNLVANREEQISVNRLSEGMYFLSVQTQNGKRLSAPFVKVG